MNRTRRSIVLAFILSVPALAHEFWIEPAQFRIEPRAAVALSIKVGSGTEVEERQWLSSRISRCFAKCGKEAIEITGTDGDLPAIRFTPPQDGVWTVSYRSTDSTLELEPAKFENYLREEGLERVVEERKKLGESAKSGREVYSRCAKSEILVGSAMHSEADHSVGLPLELSILDAEDRSQTPRTRVARLVFNDAPLEGALVKAVRLDELTNARSGRTDKEGRVSFEFAPGKWRITSVHMVREDKLTKTADWRSYWASLTFEAPARSDDVAPKKAPIEGSNSQG